MSSLLDETIEMLKFFDRDLNDILWIGTKNGRITVDTFKKFAIVEINTRNEATLARDLIIMGTDFMMVRGVEGSVGNMEVSRKPLHGHI